MERIGSASSPTPRRCCTPSTTSWADSTSPTCRRCGPRAGCSPTRRGPRIPTRSTSRPVRWASDPRHPSSRPRRDAMSMPTSVHDRPVASSRSSVTPNWTRATSGKRCPTTQPRAWARSCGSSTSTVSPSTGSCPASGSTSGGPSSRRPAGTCSRSSGGRVSPRHTAGPGEPVLRPGSTPCPTSATNPSSASSPQRCASVSSRGRRTRWSPSSRVCRTQTWRPSSPTSVVTTSTPCSPPMPSATP